MKRSSTGSSTQLFNEQSPSCFLSFLLTAKCETSLLLTQSNLKRFDAVFQKSLSQFLPQTCQSHWYQLHLITFTIRKLPCKYYYREVHFTLRLNTNSSLCNTTLSNILPVKSLKNSFQKNWDIFLLMDSEHLIIFSLH